MHLINSLAALAVTLLPLPSNRTKQSLVMSTLAKEISWLQLALKREIK
jgi:hypothetical protein